MSDTISNTYFIKALDNYPHALEETLENLNYALSYDENNADVHCLLAKFYLNELKDFEVAQHHLEEALANNIDHIKSYYCFINLYIIIEEYDKATKLIDFANTVKGINKTTLTLQQGLIFEKQGNFKAAKKLAKKAIITSINEDDLEYFKNVLRRICFKMNLIKPKKKKKRKVKGKKQK